jgi:hypothetical protein
MQPKLREELLQATVPAPTLLTVHDIAELAHVDPSTVSRWSRNGSFPRALISDGAKMRRWLTQDYIDWINAKRAQRDGVPVPTDKRTVKRRRYA